MQYAIRTARWELCRTSTAEILLGVLYKGVVEERVLALGDSLNRRAPEDDNFRWSHFGLELVATSEA